MKVVVFGAGSLGSLVGGLLTRRHEVTLVGRQAHVQAIEESGLVITGLVEAVVVPRAAESLQGIGPAEMVVITVKAYDTARALEQIGPLVGPGTIVVSLQNGLTIAEMLDAAFPSNGVVGVTAMGATRSGNGRVFYAGEGDTFFGVLSSPKELALRAAEAFTSVGMDAYASDDIITEVWSKAIVNASINPLTAVARCKNGKVLQDPDLRALSEAASREGAAIAKACGVDLGEEDAFERTKDVLRRTAENRSSMFQDVERRRRTEIDEITGELVRRGEAAGAEAPVNRALWHLVRALSRYQ